MVAVLDPMVAVLDPPPNGSSWVVPTHVGEHRRGADPAPKPRWF